MSHESTSPFSCSKVLHMVLLTFSVAPKLNENNCLQIPDWEFRIRVLDRYVDTIKDVYLKKGLILLKEEAITEQ